MISVKDEYYLSVKERLHFRYNSFWEIWLTSDKYFFRGRHNLWLKSVFRIYRIKVSLGEPGIESYVLISIFLNEDIIPIIDPYHNGQFLLRIKVNDCPITIIPSGLISGKDDLNFLSSRSVYFLHSPRCCRGCRNLAWRPASYPGLTN